jgi:hypothetical protein
LPHDGEIVCPAMSASDRSGIPVDSEVGVGLSRGINPGWICSRRLLRRELFTVKTWSGSMQKFCLSLGTLIVGGNLLIANTGPFNPEALPPTVNAQKKVHYVSVDGTFTPPNANWLADELRVLSGGDQATQAINIGGHQGLKVTGNYLNIADASFQEWADDDVIDILMQVYGDAALLNATGQPRNFNFLTGTLPEIATPVGGSIPVTAKNQKWNWVLFRIPNGIRPSDGSHYVGSIPANAQGATAAGGVNGGTIRFQGVPGLIFRFAAFGEQGAFGETNQVNVFATGEQCAPEPETNLAFIDFHKGMTNRLVLLNTGDQTVTAAENIGPAADRRRAVRPNGSYMNFAISDNYLGRPCNEPRNVRICVEVYDAPELAGMVFGPEAYATDALTGTGTYPAERRHKLEGSGQWVRRSFTVSAVNLKGINTGTLTGGPRLIFETPNIFISSFSLAVLRVGSHPLAGQDPLADCVEDPKICTDAYGNFVEFDLVAGTQNGLAPGSSGGDQEMIQEETGPANDRRLAIRPAFNDGTPGAAHRYMNFAIQNEALGPSSQPNARLGICVTYYDDPALVGASFRPEVYQSDRGGQLGLAFTPANSEVALEGTGKWRNAYFEIPDIKFNGVNQGPQAAARFVFSPTQAPYGKVGFSRVRYTVIRPCGPKAGVNLLADCQPADKPQLTARLNANRTIRFSWPMTATGFRLEESSSLVPANWTAVATAAVTEGTDNVVNISLAGGGARFYRLAK